MNHKNTIFTAILVLLIISIASAQIEVAHKLTKDDLAKLKSTKTIFVYGPRENPEELEKILNSVWDFTEISLVSYKEVTDIDYENTSVFSLGGYNTHVTRVSQHNTLQYDHTHLYLSLWMKAKNEKGEEAQKSFARIELHPIYVDYVAVTGSRKNSSYDYLYEKATLKNYNTGLLKIYMQVVNNFLKNGESRWLYKSENNSPELKNLAENKLYITDYALVKFGKYTGDESTRHEEEKLFKTYPYDYELINREDLSTKILESDSPFYFMVYIKSSTDKYLTVYNSATGQIVYSKYRPVSYNIEKSDFKKLTKAINK